MSHDTNPPPTPTVIGLGPMGQAMTRALLAAGRRVTVWNRTARRADGVVADGAALAATPADAVAASDLVILSLTDYPAMYDILGDGTGAARHGAGFVTGGVMAPAPTVGTEAASVYYTAHYRRAIDDGHGGDNWTRIIDGIRDPR